MDNGHNSPGCSGILNRVSVEYPNRVIPEVSSWGVKKTLGLGMCFPRRFVIVLVWQERSIATGLADSKLLQKEPTQFHGAMDHRRSHGMGKGEP